LPEKEGTFILKQKKGKTICRGDCSKTGKRRKKKEKVRGGRRGGFSNVVSAILPGE